MNWGLIATGSLSIILGYYRRKRTKAVVETQGIRIGGSEGFVLIVLGLLFIAAGVAEP